MSKYYIFIKKYKFLILIVLVIIIKVIFVVINSNFILNTNLVNNNNSEIEQNEVKEIEKSESNTEFVDVKGAVVNPGLYEVDASYRVGQVIEEAGGFSHANTQCVNLSQKISDEQLIYIPDKSQMCESAEKNSQNNDLKKEEDTNSSTSSLININSATEEELMNLTGIGQTRAADIVAYREENGDFSQKEDIKNVSGIGDSIYEDIKDQITV